MAKDPAFLFYPGDWLGGTMGLTLEEKGAYLELLIFQFNCGKFTKDQAKHVLSICSAYAFENVLKKFQTDGIFYWKQRLFDEMERRKRYTDSRKNNAKGLKNNKLKKSKTNKKNEKAYAKHMETEIETETITKNKTENETEKAKNLQIVFPFTSERFMKTWANWKLFRAQIKKPYRSTLSEQMALKKLSEHDEDTAIAMIEQSIANSWQGIFDVTEKSNGKLTAREKHLNSLRQNFAERASKID